MINSELKTLCERIARLEEERKTIAADILEVKKEAESAGFDKKLVAKNRFTVYKLQNVHYFLVAFYVVFIK